jgi:2-polyprenyl-6-methoxyphenol hydroxylase-like FAD-dependent oxidoreductase
MDRLFEDVLATSPRLSQGLAGAQRITPVHTAANFSYRIVPTVGDRYLAVGDATGFVDPIFSAGVFIAMRSAELAAEAIVHAFGAHDFSARRFQPYANRIRSGVAPFLALVKRFYEPAFLDLFFSSQPPVRMYRAALWVLSGAAFDHRPLWQRGGLGCFFLIVNLRKALRWVAGLPVESRWHW